MHGAAPEPRKEKKKILHPAGNFPTNLTPRMLSISLTLPMSEDEIIRKTVGRRPEHLTVFERLRRLNAFVRKLNIKHSDDGEHIRRVVGPSSRK
jgi:hypothetical protein